MAWYLNGGGSSPNFTEKPPNLHRDSNSQIQRPNMNKSAQEPTPPPPSTPPLHGTEEDLQKENERLKKELEKLRRLIFPQEAKVIFQSKGYHNDIWAKTTINDTFEEDDFNDLLKLIEKSLLLRSAKLCLNGFSDDQITQLKNAWVNSQRCKKKLHILSTDSFENNLLHIYCSNPNSKKGKLTIHEEHINQQNRGGNIPLHILFQNYNPKYIKIAEYLIDKSDLNTINRNGQTPLLTFCTYFNNQNNNFQYKKKVMELLLLNRQKISLRAIEKVINSTTEVYRDAFHYHHRNNRFIDRNLFHLIGIFDKKKIRHVVRDEIMKYFGNFQGLRGKFIFNGKESNFESFKTEEFFIIQSRILLHIIVDLKKTNHPQLPFGFSFAEVEKLLIEEFAQLLELFHARANYLIANENSNKNQVLDPLPDWAITAITKNIHGIIMQLKEGGRYVYNAGAAGHSFYILFIKKKENIFQVIYINLGVGVGKHYRYSTDKNNQKYNYFFPYAFEINTGELQNFLEVIIANRNISTGVAINKIYNYKPQLAEQIIRNMFKGQERREQNAQNCVFENYYPILGLKWSREFLSWFKQKIMTILMSQIHPHYTSITRSEFDAENLEEFHKEINVEGFLNQQFAKIQAEKNDQNSLEKIIKQTSIGLYKLHNYSSPQISILLSNEIELPEEEIKNSHHQLLEFAILHKKFAISNSIYNSLANLKNNQILNEQNSQGDTLKSLFSLEKNVIEKDDVKITKKLKLTVNSTVCLGTWGNKDYAIKILNIPQFSPEDTIRRFHREAAIGCRLNHPNIIKHYAYTPFHPYYIVLEYMSHHDLKSFLKDPHNNLTRQLKIFICIEITKGLEYLHSLEIIHRDLKPNNILVNEKERIKGGEVEKLWEFKIADFGIAKIADKEGNASNSGFTGSFKYWSPENANGNLIFTKSSDVYALGVIFWEIFTGQEPFPGLNDMQIINLIKKSAKKNNYALQIPNDLHFGNLIRQCWQINANDRPSAKEILSILQSFPA